MTILPVRCTTTKSTLFIVDLLVNNAGLVKGVEKVGDVADEDIDVILDTNVKGLMCVLLILDHGTVLGCD